jgi:hypothetical protein
MAKAITNIILVSILGVVIALFVVVLAKDNNINVDVPDIQIPDLGGGSFNQMNASCTHAVISVSTVSTGTAQVLAENYAATYRRIQNIGNTMVSCNLDPATSTLAVGKGIVLYSSSSVSSIYEMDDSNLYQKKVNCIAQTSTGTISAIECY